MNEFLDKFCTVHRWRRPVTPPPAPVMLSYADNIYIYYDTVRRLGGPNEMPTPQEKEEMALIAAMRTYDLEPGQMLLFGPKSVAAVSKPGAFRGKLEDVFIFERNEALDKKRRR